MIEVWQSTLGGIEWIPVEKSKSCETVRHFCAGGLGVVLICGGPGGLAEFSKV